MKGLLDSVLFVAWVAAYLALIARLGQSRRARAHALGPIGRSGYRADRDAGLWLAVFLLGVLSFVLVYFLSRAIG